ncbi:MFS transporter [Microbacterium azadirachtae]|uniref:Putative niacin/nicotinamide transporter NaiP n=1 Tax=Microbacterium azadirachtae TaxID=582680 RepID=A0A0F0LJJ7_9MICO|nr:MFS transporter [Microbacterium azadirachtae]KJL32490.1 putative niacin/nicotinamide transporter NaiP [Microbacterium azadirachtae]UXW86675.1 sugar porter family MFS transporter [Microbacterium azadirachtae]SDL83802.1 MFS transporter, SP family, inositol transporter [Microbacterium azadirachtae]SEG22965.1 MFS transporter, SP family, inositol transporter [Microbacterium azadirachtae]SEG25369.1 MFS transporter, SP family, inositol transporter [Microbacterium azadirachtae]
MTVESPAVRQPNPWWVGVVCGMASYIDAATIVATGIALVIYQHTIGITPDQIGILSGMLTLSIAIGAIFGGRLGDAFGRRRVFLVTMLVVIVGIALLVFGSSFPALLVGVVFAGLGTGADLPVSLSTISEAASEKNRGAIIGLSNILWVVGILGTIVIATFAGGLGRIGGQLLFGQVGIIAALVFLARLTIPESPFWLAARDERRRGVVTVRADRASVRDLLRKPYLAPFLALLVFYALTNVGANTGGQFGTYLAVNVAGIPVETNSAIGLLSFPIGLLAGLWFMRIVDGKHRMTYFVFGAIVLLLGYLTPAVLGFSLPTIIAMNLFMGVGGAFAFEGIMKVWTQESFPTLLRTTAQGAVIAVARVVAALLAFVTPALIAVSPQGLYAVLSGVVAVGLIVAWFAFRKAGESQFVTESLRTVAVEPEPEADAAPVES